MTDPAALREKAENFRRIALAINDRRAIAALKELAERYDAEARQLEAEQRDQSTNQ